MTTHAHEQRTPDESLPMTPDRWRAVDAILKGALARSADERDAFVADACGDDAGLRHEVASLMAAYDDGDDFLERPAAESFGSFGPAIPMVERLATALEGRYAIEREVASGGMATVFLGRDLKHDRRVAIKVLREELAAALGAGRFLEEIRVTASLQHPHILPLFDSGSVSAGQGPALLYYVMPYVEGETLRTKLSREGRLPVDAAVQIAREMADALDHAHRQGVVHRDVKPENVLLQGGHALMGDFGIALALEHAGGDRLTRTGISIGTPQYMAPEQAAGERAIDARADVYALGAVLHEMLVGESPFPGASQAAVLWRVRNQPATAVSTHRIDVAPYLDAAVRRALEKRPDDRFPSASAFAAAITGSPSQMEANPAALGAGAQPSTGRRVSARAAVYAAVVMLLVGLIGGWMLGRSMAPKQSPTTAANPAPDVNVSTNPWQRSTYGNTELVMVDRTGRPLRTLPVNRPWTPRFSPDGRRVAYGAFGPGRTTSDIYVTDLDKGSTLRLTNDDRDNNDPQWSPDGKRIAYSVNVDGGKDLFVKPSTGGDSAVLAARDGTQWPSDWVRDGSALLVTDDASGRQHDIIVQPSDGSTARPYAETGADESAARISPDGHWVAYTSDESGRSEVYLDSYPRPGHRKSLGAGTHPVWRGDGQELYYWTGDALMAAQLGWAKGDTPPPVSSTKELFRARYEVMGNTMYDVSSDGQRFVIVRRLQD